MIDNSAQSGSDHVGKVPKPGTVEKKSGVRTTKAPTAGKGNAKTKAEEPGHRTEAPQAGSTK